MLDENDGPSSSIANVVSIGEVIRQSGATRQTIHFYLRKGLLPKPRRSSRTYALYSSDTVEFLTLIRECKTQFRLSLDEIVKLFVAASYNLDRIRSELHCRGSSANVGGITVGTGNRRLTAEEVLGTIHPAPPPHWLKELHRADLLDGSDEKYGTEEVELIRSVWDLRRIGTGATDLCDLSRSVSREGEVQLAAFRQIVDRQRRGSADTDYGAVLRTLDVFERFVKFKRASALNSALSDWLFPAEDSVYGPNQRRVVPSETFLMKIGLNLEIDRLLHQLDKTPEDPRTLRDLARAYSLRSDWLNLYLVSERLLKLDSTNARTFENLTTAMYYLGRLDEAIGKLETRLLSCGDPLLKFRLGQSLVLRAKNRGIREFFNAVIRRQQLTTEALQGAKNQPSVRRWITLTQALDDQSIYDPLQLNQPTIPVLEALYEEYQSISSKQLSPLGRMNLAGGKILAACALYREYCRQQDPKALQLRRKIMQMDPQSLLAARSRVKSRSVPESH